MDIEKYKAELEEAIYEGSDGRFYIGGKVIEKVLKEVQTQALGKSDVRTSCFRECWEMWLKCDSEKDFVKWLHGQLHEA